MNTTYKRKIKNIGCRGLIYSSENATYYEHKEMMIGIVINLKENGGYWMNTVEVLLYAVHKGYKYNRGIKEYKSRHALSINVNIFVKDIINNKIK